MIKKTIYSLFIIMTVTFNPLSTFAQTDKATESDKSNNKVITIIYNNYVSGSVVLGMFPWLQIFSSFADIPYKKAVVLYHDQVRGNKELEDKAMRMSPLMYSFLEERIRSNHYSRFYKKKNTENIATK